jgi:hypothetical protein
LDPFLKEAIIHSRSPVIRYCGNPSTITTKTISIQMSMLAVVLGVGIWIASFHFQIAAMGEVARALCYGGVFNIFGINLGIKTTQVKRGIKG